MRWPGYLHARDASTLARLSREKDTLATLLLRPGWRSAVSQWGLAELLAHRVICREPAKRLPFFNNFSRDLGTTHGCIADLLKGPASIDALKTSSEYQIVRRYQPDSLGYVWAALLPFVRPGPEETSPPAASPPSTPEQKRERKATERYGGIVSYDPADLGSSPQRPATSLSNSSFSSAGYMEKLEASLLEDATIRLAASCFIRCVLNYAQPVDRLGPFLEFRDERLSYSYKLGDKFVHAIDDGGTQVFGKATSAPRQVVLLEGKRTFHKIVNGEAVVADELLAQMVREALALTLETNSGGMKKGVSPTE
ncbi:hypothetical protein TOPH_08076 [Tolypocladium ophioglossoides CBS 100239]|uniref:Uncharacterized protein n=1 Tax=Tolypocladium ophioglossoides (strain CBS 100239) TaxID=1163406 RepID=A0A0L0MZS8_TOLOC|nr:hypothetical protein TOPH_08076 [Tolypocladium ophioglossoides CBS 100239]